jgi:FMN phosphatase YigB (HAD superfamily)
MHVSHADVVVLLDCDNTLLDNDALAADLRAHIEREYGVASRDRYWAILEEMRGEEGYGDYVGALRRFWFTELPDPRLLLLSSFILGYPFAELLYPGALNAVAHLHRAGLPVILSDGNVVFQSWKIQRAGLWDAVDGRVLIYVHKEHMLQIVEETFPASHYIMVDDKPRILSAMKEVLGPRLTTVAVHQGYNATAAASAAVEHPADVTVEHIADLAAYDIETLIYARQRRPTS